MLVVKVDYVNAQPAQACFARSADVIGLTVHPARRGICRIAHYPEFRGQNNLVALAFDRAAHQFFIFVWAVDIRSVEKIYAQLEGTVNGGDGFAVIAWTIKFRHAHAAEAEGRAIEATASSFAQLHDDSFRNTL